MQEALLTLLLTFESVSFQIMSYLSLRWVIKGASLLVVGLGALSVPALSSSKSALPRLVKDIVPGYGDNIQHLTNVNGTLYFAANDKLPSTTRLWKSNGTAAGTVVVKNVAPQNLTNVNGTLFFTVFDSNYGRELWKSNGTAAGTVLVKDIDQRLGRSSNPDKLTNVNGTLFFTANEGLKGIELWKSNGTAAGTVLVKDIRAQYDSYGFGLSSNPDKLTNVNGKVYFTAQEGVNGIELWKSDGTAAGTVLVKDIYSGISQGFANSSRPDYLTNVNGTLFFKAIEKVSGIELWKSNGTAAGTVLVKDINPGSLPTNSSPSHFTNINGTLYFTAYDKVHGRELWKSDGTAAGTVLVKDIRPGVRDSFPQTPFPLNFMNVNGTLYFHADDGVHGRELWKSDGTAAGTVLVKDINPEDIYPGVNHSYPQDFINANGTLYFKTFLGTDFDLWKSNGTAKGTVLVQKRVASTGNSLALVNGKLYFTGPYGDNLFVIDKP
jgi:ELWxxDGT repeat protein